MRGLDVDIDTRFRELLQCVELPDQLDRHGQHHAAADELRPVQIRLKVRQYERDQRIPLEQQPVRLFCHRDRGIRKRFRRDVKTVHAAVIGVAHFGQAELHGAGQRDPLGRQTGSLPACETSVKRSACGEHLRDGRGRRRHDAAAAVDDLLHRDDTGRSGRDLHDEVLADGHDTGRLRKDLVHVHIIIDVALNAETAVDAGVGVVQRQQKLGALRGQRVHDFPQKLVLVLFRETLPHGKNAFVPQLRFGYDRIGHDGRGGGNAAVCVRKAVFNIIHDHGIHPERGVRITGMQLIQHIWHDLRSTLSDETMKLFLNPIRNTEILKSNAL